MFKIELSKEQKEFYKEILQEWLKMDFEEMRKNYIGSVGLAIMYWQSGLFTIEDNGKFEEYLNWRRKQKEKSVFKKIKQKIEEMEEYDIERMDYGKEVPDILLYFIIWDDGKKVKDYIRVNKKYDRICKRIKDTFIRYEKINA